jgi:hypothetical protein
MSYKEYTAHETEIGERLKENTMKERIAINK